MVLNDDIDELINLCWERINVHSNHNGFIFVEKILDLIIEMENILKFKGLFTTDEVKLLRLMINEKPLLKLYKVDILRFLLRLVQYPDFELYLKERANLSLSDLRRLLRSERLKTYNIMLTSRNNNLGINLDKHSRITPPTSPIQKDTYGFTRKLPNPKDKVSDTSYIHEDRGRFNNVGNLETEIKRLNNYIKTLENRLTERSTDRNIRDLLKDLKNKDRKIVELENLCKMYQKEILDYQVNEERKRPAINNLILSLQRQNELIGNLKSKIDLDLQDEYSKGTKKKFISVIRNFPILKQYYIYFKYKNQQKNFGMLIVNIITLILSVIILINIFQFALYIFIWIINVIMKSNGNIVNEDINIASTFSWWKEITWLDYLVYRLSA